MEASRKSEVERERREREAAAAAKAHREEETKGNGRGGGGFLNEAVEDGLTADQREVSEFLEQAGLGQYVKKFFDEGFDDLETVVEMENEDIHLIGMKRGHQKKFIKIVKKRVR